MWKAEYTPVSGKTGCMKGYLLILIANILFGVGMPVFKCLLASDFQLEEITYMCTTFAYTIRG